MAVVVVRIRVTGLVIAIELVSVVWVGWEDLWDHGWKRNEVD